MSDREEPPQKRFRYATYNERLKQISVDAGKSRGLGWEKDDQDEDTEQHRTPISSELARLGLQDLTIPYQQLSRDLYPLTTTLPTILLNTPVVAARLHAFLGDLQPGSDHLHSGLPSALSLLQAFYETCLGEALEYVPQSVSNLLRVGALPKLDPDLVEKTYSATSGILRTVGGSLLKAEPANQELLRATWLCAAPYLQPKDNQPYVRKCVTDVWVAIVRKARAESLSRLMDLMLGGEHIGMDMLWVEAMRGTGNALHSRALQILETLLSKIDGARVGDEKPAALCASIDRVLTALVHHCSSSTIAPVVSSVTAKLEDAISRPTEISFRLSNVSTLLLTRKGKRFPPDLLKPTMKMLLCLVKQLRLPEQEQYLQALVLCVCGALCAGKLEIWLSPGVTLINELWSRLNSKRRLAFANTLIAAKWAGMEQFLLPQIVQFAVPSLEACPLEILGLLNNLADTGLLERGLVNVQAGRLRPSLLLTLRNRLEGYSTSVSFPRKEMIDLLRLISRFPDAYGHFESVIVSMVENLLGPTTSAPSAKEQWSKTGPFNDAACIAEALGCLRRLATTMSNGDNEQSEDERQKADRIRRITSGYYWHRGILVEVAEALDTMLHTPDLSNDTLARLRSQLLSIDPVLRRSSLRVLARCDGSNLPGTDPSASLWEQCLDIENAQISLKNVRERPLEIAKLAKSLASLPAASCDQEQLKGVARYLSSQLKIRFRPIWSGATAALAEMATTHGDIVWDVVWDQLERTLATEIAFDTDLELQEPAWVTAHSERAETKVVAEEVIELRCPSNIKTRQQLDSFWSDQLRMDGSEETKAQIHEEKLDILAYESQLVGVLAASPALAEKHTRLLVPAFLSIAAKTEDRTLPFSAKRLQDRTSSWLELFAKLSNPKAAFQAEALRRMYMDILGKGDSRLQGHALKCLMTYKTAGLQPYREHLERLLDESRFRDELAHFRLGVDSDVIEPTHRSAILPVCIRLLYGLLTARKGRSSSHAMASRRQAILTALCECTSAELEPLVDLMLEPLQCEIRSVPGRRQLGYLSLLGDVLRYLGTAIVAHWPKLLRTTIALVDNAQRGLADDIETQSAAPAQEELLQDDDASEAELEMGQAVLAPLRTIRSEGTKRLVQFLRLDCDFDFSPELKSMYGAAISPRLPKFEQENTQGPSATLELVAGLAALPRTARSLISIDARTLPKVFACIDGIKVKPTVVLRVFDIVESLLADEEDGDDSVCQMVLRAQIDPLLASIVGLMTKLKLSSGEDVTRRLLDVLSRLSRLVTDARQAQQLAIQLAPMLRQSSRVVTEHAKARVLGSLRHLYAMCPDFKDASSGFFWNQYQLVCQLLESLFFPSSRTLLLSVLELFPKTEQQLAGAVALAIGINSYSSRRPEEPDFEVRLAAFANIIGDTEALRSPQDWLPINRSSLFFLRDQDELSIRTNASAALNTFIDQISTAEDGPLVEQLEAVVLPGVRRCLGHKSELVRNEALAVLDHAAKICTGISSLRALQSLADPDDDINFFLNIAHIQVHRRTRAIRRLRDIAASGTLDQAAIVQVLLPVLDHVLAGSTEVTDHHLINEAIASMGALAANLRWSKYSSLLLRYLRRGSPTDVRQRYYVRVVLSIIDNYHFDSITARCSAEEDADDEDPQGDDPLDSVPGEQTEATDATILSAVSDRILPALAKFVDQKNETEDSIRIPVAFGIAKLANTLPPEIASTEVRRVITTVSQMLRSKSQDTRDIARDTIGKIAIHLGPQWLPTILDELRDALQRGPQKHVYAVTTHSILVHATTEAKARFSNLDDAVEEAARISAEVIWGESGKDAESEGFQTKMREVKGASSRGLDTFQLLATLASPAKISAILAPVTDIMRASQKAKAMSQVDEVLRRIALGLNANAKVGVLDLLSLVHSLVSGNSRHLRVKQKNSKHSRHDRHIVQMKRKILEDDDFFALNAHKLIAFGLDLFTTAYRRGRFDFGDVDTLSRLGPLVSAVGNTLDSAHTEVLQHGLKATAAICRCPLPQVADSLAVFVDRVFKIIKSTGGSAGSDLPQTGLRTLAVLLRDCNASLSESQLRKLLELVQPDLEDPERQAAIFAILRATISRQFVIPEIYDCMDRISSIMVTSHSAIIQAQCRSVLLAFLLDFPQGPARLKSQMEFLAQNLSYVFESGRMSVMELLADLLRKFSDELLSDFADMFFVALVAVYASDDAQKCRAMAAALIQSLVNRLDSEHSKRITAILERWIDGAEDNPTLAATALSVLALLLDTPRPDDALSSLVPGIVSPILSNCAGKLATAEMGDAISGDLDHAAPHSALQCVGRALQANGELAVDLPWNDIASLMLYPHSWVRFAAVKAMIALLDTASASPSVWRTLPADLQLAVARKGCQILAPARDDDGVQVSVDKRLSDEVVKLLYRLVQRWMTSAQLDDHNGSPESGSVDGDGDGAEEAIEEDHIASKPLAWIMSRMSYMARGILISRPSLIDDQDGLASWSVTVVAILRFFGGVYESFSAEQAKRYLRHGITPIYRILEDAEGRRSSEQAVHLDTIHELAVQIRDLIQVKVGVSEFSAMWESLRQSSREKRESRRADRKRLPVANPDAWVAQKERRSMAKKAMQKKKVAAFANKKERSHPSRRRAQS